MFKPGESGNPRGKPPGTKNHATRLAEALIDGEAETLTRRAIELALQGDAVALRLCIERIYPAPKSRRLALDVSDDALADPTSAVSLIQRAMLRGELDPTSADAAIDVLTRRSSTADALAGVAAHPAPPPVAPSMELWTAFAKAHCDANSGEPADK